MIRPDGLCAEAERAVEYLSTFMNREEAAGRSDNIGRLVCFATGHTHPPAVGSTLGIEVALGTSGWVPKAAICFNCIYIDSRIRYEEFEPKMVAALSEAHTPLRNS